MHEVVGEYSRVATLVTGTNHSHIGWAELSQASYECSRPVHTHKPRVIVHPAH